MLVSSDLFVLVLNKKYFFLTMYDIQFELHLWDSDLSKLMLISPKVSFWPKYDEAKKKGN